MSSILIPHGDPRFLGGPLSGPLSCPCFWDEGLLHVYYAAHPACISARIPPEASGLALVFDEFQARTCHTKIRTRVGTDGGPGAESTLFIA